MVDWAISTNFSLNEVAIRKKQSHVCGLNAQHTFAGIPLIGAAKLIEYTSMSNYSKVRKYIDLATGMRTVSNGSFIYIFFLTIFNLPELYTGPLKHIKIFECSYRLKFLVNC